MELNENSITKISAFLFPRLWLSREFCMLMSFQRHRDFCTTMKAFVLANVYFWLEADRDKAHHRKSTGRRLSYDKYFYAKCFLSCKKGLKKEKKDSMRMWPEIKTDSNNREIVVCPKDLFRNGREVNSTWNSLTNLSWKKLYGEPNNKWFYREKLKRQGKAVKQQWKVLTSFLKEKIKLFHFSSPFRVTNRQISKHTNTNFSHGTALERWGKPFYCVGNFRLRTQ